MATICRIRALGTSRTVLTCECCGKTFPDLTYTVRLTGFPDGSERYYGSDCAERAVAGSKPWAPLSGSFERCSVTVDGRRYTVSPRSFDAMLTVSGYGVLRSFARDEAVSLREQVAGVVEGARAASRAARATVQGFFMRDGVVVERGEMGAGATITGECVARGEVVIPDDWMGCVEMMAGIAA